MTVTQTAAKQSLYRLIDELPDEQTPLLIDFIHRLLDADDEPLTPDELRQIKASNAQIEAGEFYTMDEVDQRRTALS